MIEWLDSATPPTTAQVAAARAAGYGGWAGYFAGLHVLHGWSDDDFHRVKAGGLRTLAYCSGWADPLVMKARGLALGIPICLDDEPGMRTHGPWTQPWIDAAGAGQYGNCQYHLGINAAFHILAAYPTSGDPDGLSWSFGCRRPVGLCGWQWAGSHNFAGVTVDSSWFDDGIGGVFGAGGGELGGVDMTLEELSANLTVIRTRVDQIIQLVINGDDKALGLTETSYLARVVKPELDAISKALEQLPATGATLTATQAQQLQEAHDAILRIEAALKTA